MYCASEWMYISFRQTGWIYFYDLREIGQDASDNNNYQPKGKQLTVSLVNNTAQWSKCLCFSLRISRFKVLKNLKQPT